MWGDGVASVIHVKWRRVRSSVDGLPFVPVVATQAGRRKLAGAKGPSRLQNVNRKHLRQSNVFNFALSIFLRLAGHVIDGTPCALKGARTV